VSSVAEALPARSKVLWPKATRIIRSLYPPIDLFEDIADPADWELLARAEAKTNPRVRDQIGQIALVPPARRVSGPGASWVMAPFTHVSPARPTRFSAGDYGVYYCGKTFEVALRETVHHFERSMRATREPKVVADYRELVSRVHVQAHDLRGDERFAACLDPADYGQSQALARRVRDSDASEGIVYPSVRAKGGEALAVFFPDRISLPTQRRHLAYRWDGERCDAYFVYGQERWQLLP
jgi:RES domain-containing protein